jgi:hypothetical protein
LTLYETGKKLTWTAYVAKTGSEVFRVPRPPVFKKWLLRNVGSSETSKEIAVEILEPREKSGPVVPSKKSVAEERLTVQPSHIEANGGAVSLLPRGSWRYYTWLGIISGLC